MAAAASSARATLSGTLSDRLNPTHPAFDSALKAKWSTMSRKEKKSFIEDDAKQLEERANVNSVPAEYAFHATTDDHCETGPEAYADIAPVLHALAKVLGRSAAELAIYDPYFCTGATARHLAGLGFTNVYNKNEDFYATAKANKMPPFDVLLTNPAYSGDHIPRLFDICSKLGKPFLLLMPNYVSGKDYFAAARSQHPDTVGKILFMYPAKRYTYWTPRGLRTKQQSHSSAQGNRTSPFISFWYCYFGSYEAAVLSGIRKRKCSGAAGAGSREQRALLQMARSVHDLPPAVRPTVIYSGKPTVGSGAGAGGGRAERGPPQFTPVATATSASSSSAPAPAELAAGSKRPRPGHWKVDDEG